MRTRVVRTVLIAAIVLAATASSASAATIVRGRLGALASRHRDGSPAGAR